jgi:hypothetical protein
MEEAENSSVILEVPYDYISRFGHASKYTSVPSKPLTKIQEVKLVQKLLKDVKYVLTFEPDILQEQNVYWLYLTGVLNATLEQRNSIKLAIESHCLTPVVWVTNDEIEITINPANKIPKKKI